MGGIARSHVSYDRYLFCGIEGEMKTMNMKLELDWEERARNEMLRRGLTPEAIELIIKNQTCQECGGQAWGAKYGKPSWYVDDKVWAAAGYKPEDIACQHCLGVRLRARFELNPVEPAARQVHHILVTKEAALRELGLTLSTQSR
jgi:hypothetical protein